MKDMPNRLSAEIWMQRIFDAKAARQGGIVRRSMQDIEFHVGRAAFERELRRRGYRALCNGDQVIIICNSAPVRIWV